MVALFCVVMKKTGNFLATCLILMVYSWQVSWYNIFGNPTSSLQLPWLYILGAMIFVYGVCNIRNSLKRSYSFAALFAFTMFFILFLYPLFISQTFSSALKEFISIAFFVVVVLVCYLNKNSVGKDVYEHFKRALIWAVVLTSVFILIQYVLYTYMDIRLFKIAVRLSFKGYQTSFYLLMEDHSSATIMLGCAAFYVLDGLKRKTHGITSRR